MKKTALQELIEKLEQNIQEFLDYKKTPLNNASIVALNAYYIAINEAKALLPTERQQIENACKAGMNTSITSSNYHKQYFDEIYN